jgi:hypothetical protein
MRMHKMLGRFPVVWRSNKPQWVVNIRERKGEANVLLSLTRALLGEEGCAFLSSPNPPFRLYKTMPSRPQRISPASWYFLRTLQPLDLYPRHPI